MNRVFLNNEEITNFDNDTDTVEFVENLLAGKERDFFYSNTDDSLAFELEGQGIIDVAFSDLDSNGKLKIF